MFNEIECERCHERVHFLIQTTMGEPLLCSDCLQKDKDKFASKMDEDYGALALKLLEEEDQDSL